MLAVLARKSAVPALLLAVACRDSDVIAPTPASGDLMTMSVGEVRIFNPANVWNGFRLTPGSSAQSFIFIVANTNPRLDVEQDYIVQTDWLPLASVSASRLSAESSLNHPRPNHALKPQEVLDNRLRAFERASLTLQSQPVAFGTSAFSPRRANRATSAALAAPGDTLSIKIPDAATDDLCTSFIPTKAVVASVSRRAILAVDTLDGPPLTLFPQAVLDSITQEFDDVTYPTDSSYFNNPTDIDGNGRVIIVFSGQINKLTLPGETDFVGGFFFAGDFFPTTGTQAGTFCPQSNRAEIFYLLAPDPTGRFNNNRRSTSSVRQGTRGVIAHEFQHMINAGNRYLNAAVSEFEVTWLDEALAHAAEDAVGRTLRGFTDLQTLTVAELLPSGDLQAANDFNAFFFQNLARLTYWMLRPDTSSGISAHADRNLSSRGAGWAILRYAADNYSNANPRALTQRLAAGPDTGIANFTAATQAPIDTLVSGWLISMYADHLGIPGLDPKYQYRSYNFRNVMPVVARAVLNTQAATYPLQVTAIGSGPDTVQSTNRSGSGTYFSLSVAPNTAPRTVELLNATPNSILNCCLMVDEEWRRRFYYPGAFVYVLRVQ